MVNWLKAARRVHLFHTLTLVLNPKRPGGDMKAVVGSMSLQISIVTKPKYMGRKVCSFGRRVF